MQLKQAWEYHTGALKPETHLKSSAAFEATPILVDGTLYLSTPFDQVIALDPGTGKERWVFDPKVNRKANYSEVSSRGVSTWLDSTRKEGDPCRRRIFIGTIDARLIAIDAATGKERWTYDPRVYLGDDYSEISNRGVAYWPGLGGRVYIGTIDGRLSGAPGGLSPTTVT